MKLSDSDADLFFKLMMPLLAFVNIKLKILPDISTSKDFDKVTLEETAKVRNALYENIRLIDEFIDENPEDIPLKDLAIVSGWKNFVQDEFFIERYLKQHAIFIADNKVYAVGSLRDSFDEMIPSYALPLRVKTVLLPFQDCIVYDGFLAHNNIFFGSGIKEDLKHVYLKAKRRDEIIFSLDPNSSAAVTKKKSAKPAKNWKPLIKELTEKAAKLRGGAGQIEILSPTFSLVKASLELADLLTEKKIERDDIFKCFEKLERHFSNIQKELYYYDE